MLLISIKIYKLVKGEKCKEQSLVNVVSGESAHRYKGKNEYAKLENSRLQYILVCSEFCDSDKENIITKCIYASHRGTETDFINIFSLLNKQRKVISSDYKQFI